MKYLKTYENKTEWPKPSNRPVVFKFEVGEIVKFKSKNSKYFEIIGRYCIENVTLQRRKRTKNYRLIDIETMSQKDSFWDYEKNLIKLPKEEQDMISSMKRFNL